MPEASLNLIIEASGAEFLGMYGQHKSPNMEQTPFSLASSISSSFLVWIAIKEDGPSSLNGVCSQICQPLRFLWNEWD